MIAEGATAAQTRPLADALATRCSAAAGRDFATGQRQLPAVWPGCTPPVNCISTCVRPKCSGRRLAARPRCSSARRKNAGDNNQLLGSIDPGYASPELLQNSAVDARSDLFSLGCILYAMSTGHGPFWGATPADLARSVRETEPRPVGLLNPRLTAWLAAVIMKLLEKDPSRRFADAGQLSDTAPVAGRAWPDTVRRPPPRSAPELPAAIRVPINAVLASPAIEPASKSHPIATAMAAMSRPQAVDPVALAAEMATLAETVTAAAGSRDVIGAGQCWPDSSRRPF